MKRMMTSKPLIKEAAQYNKLPVKTINKMGCGNSMLLKVFVYTMICCSKYNTISRQQLVDFTGCNKDTITKAFKWLINNGYIEVKQKGHAIGDYSSSTQYIVKRNDSRKNFNWNLFKDVGELYGAESAKAFGYYFYLRSVGNNKDLGNDWCYLTERQKKEHCVQIYILMQYGLIRLRRIKADGTYMVFFMKERKYDRTEEEKKVMAEESEKVTAEDIYSMQTEEYWKKRLESDGRSQNHVRREQPHIEG